MRIFITGDSHTGALRAGARRLKDAKVQFVVQPLGMSVILPTPFFRDRGDHIEIRNETYRKRMTKLPPGEETYDVIGLSMPLFPIRLLRSLLTEGWIVDEYQPKRKLLSRSTFKAIVLNDLRYVLALISALQRQGQRVLAIGAPGPFAHHSLLAKGHVSRKQLVHAWNLYMEIAIAELEKLECAAIMPPPDFFEADGLMMSRYRHPDPEDLHHASPEFGAAILTQVEKWMLENVKVEHRDHLERS